MKGLKIIYALLTLFITIPIWYFLLYTILVDIKADRLTWFLYWVYIPVGLFASILERIANVYGEKEN
jgi:hypothetical protein